jgi:hypothetical protein
MNFSISLSCDKDGYIDRQCPSESCHSFFKVFIEDWKEKVSDEQVFCPICRIEAPANDWNTEDQMDYIKKIAVAYLSKKIHTEIKSMARKFNQNQRAGFITLSMSVGPASNTYVLPLEAAEIMQQRFVCEVCGCRYASIGAAFFCPACGHNSATSMFNQTVEAVHQIASKSFSIRNKLASEFGQDIAQNSVRLMLEDSLGRLVSAFQQFSEISFDKLPNASGIKRRKNVFQNLSESSVLWKTATSKGFEDLISKSELIVGLIPSAKHQIQSSCLM